MNQNSATGPKPEINVNAPERMLSVLTGTLLATKALRNGRFNIFKLVAAGYLLYRGATGHCPLYSKLGKERLPDPVKNINIRTSVRVNKPRRDVYAFWRKLENLPLFMKHLERVDQIDSVTSNWVARVPGGLGTIHWSAGIVEEREGSFLGWNSLPGATVENAGKVEFKEISDDWTELDIVISYRAPLGIAGQQLGKLLNPVFEKMVQDDILNFKRYIETGALDPEILPVNVIVEIE